MKKTTLKTLGNAVYDGERTLYGSEAQDILDSHAAQARKIRELTKLVRAKDEALRSAVKKQQEAKR